MYVEPFFKILFPLWIVGIGLTLNLAMPFDWKAVCVEKVHLFEAFLVHIQPEKHPVPVFHGSEVFFLDPFLPFVWMSSFCPAP